MLVRCGRGAVTRSAARTDAGRCRPKSPEISRDWFCTAKSPPGLAALKRTGRLCYRGLHANGDSNPGDLGDLVPARSLHRQPLHADAAAARGLFRDRHRGAHGQRRVFVCNALQSLSGARRHHRAADALAAPIVRKRPPARPRAQRHQRRPRPWPWAFLALERGAVFLDQRQHGSAEQRPGLFVDARPAPTRFQTALRPREETEPMETALWILAGAIIALVLLRLALRWMFPPDSR